MTLPKTPSFKLDGKTALVTGASSGIGLAAAVALAEAGASVIAVARGQDALADLAKQASKAHLDITPCPLDVTDQKSVASALDDLPPVDVLINAAGMARHRPALDVTADDFDPVINVNLKASFFLSQYVAARLIKASRPGSIITISSQMAHVGGIERSVYCASKSAVEGFTRAMAIEWGQHGIRINTIAPTFIVTALTQATFDDPEKRKWITDKIKLGRLGEVEDIMGGVVYLASDASAMVTGTSLLIDGGWCAD